ncbi:cytochrome c oxidase subunit 3 [Terracidiphilus sp.]|jgi:cytochrome c oxidase subunit 3|uniref:cytochrome c oxidase subunit 3 n=1 Tax=Terracidiphilus sp. TaxID=1964191 RepID=UPI003C297378
MPVTFTRTPPEIERKEPGIGGKPPVDRRPTGGGGGGGDDDWHGPRGSARDRLHRFRFFVFFGLSADMMAFAVLVVFFFARQTSRHLDPRSFEMIGDWRPIFLPPIVYLNTAVLVLSSLTMEMARRGIFHEMDALEEWFGLGKPAVKRARPWLAATLILGALFVAGQMEAWRQLTAEGFAFDRWATPASYFFYLITGLHALHLLLGVVFVAFCLCALSLLKQVQVRQIAVDATAWYWHTMGLAWLLLLGVLAAGQ